MSDYGPRRDPRTGAIRQGSLPKVNSLMVRPGLQRSEGLLVRGVVQNVYTYDEQAGIPSRGGDEQLAIYADCWVYSGLPNNKLNFFPRCIVSQERSGLHDGDIWVPRPTTVDTEGTLNPENIRESDIFDWDGDHVLIGFLDDSLSLPVILRSIPHPNADKNKAESAGLGDRVRVIQADGQPRFIKHRGVYWGVDDSGNFFIDSTRGNDGVFQDNGSEPAAPEDGTSGNHTIRVQPGAQYTIEGPQNQTITILPNGNIELTPEGGGAKITMTSAGQISLGDPAVDAVVLGTTWNAARAVLNNGTSQALGALAAVVTQVNTTAASLGAAPVPATDIAALTTAMNTALTTIIALLGTFEGGNYLSQNVTTRT